MAAVWLTMARKTRPQAVARKSAKLAETRERSSQRREESELARNLDDLLVELDAASTRLTTELDSRLSRLEAAKLEADQTIARLEALLEPGRLQSAAAASKPSRLQARSLAADSVSMSAKPVAGFPRTTLRGGAASQPTPATPPHPSKGTISSPAALASHPVYKLADSGMPPVVIAEKLGLPIGEVELRLNLRELK